MRNTMKKVVLLTIILSYLSIGVKAEQELPIMGIAHVAFQVSNLEQSRAYYTAYYGFEFAFATYEDSEAAYLKINDDQFLKLVSKPEGTDDNRLVEVAFQVSDIKTTVTMLQKKGLNPSPVEKKADGTLASLLIDPNGHHLLFVEYTSVSKQTLSRGKYLETRRVSDKLEHVGITITDEKAANTLYRDALGFKETWRGSRKDGGPDAWVNMETPGNRGDYVEYILINDMKPSRKQLGTMHHVCFSTDDIQKAHRDMLSNTLPDLERYKPRVGRSNRWLFNVHDLDGTRSELMESKEAVKLPTKTEVLNTLKEQHPRLISTDRVEKIKQLIQEDELAKEIWISNLEFAEELMDKEPVIYEKPDGRRLLFVSREALERIRSLALCYLILDEKKYAKRAWQELKAVTSFSDWNPSHFLDCAEMTHAVAIGYDWLYDAWNARQRKILEDAILQKGLKPALKAYSRKEGWHTGNINWNQVCNGGISIGALAIAEHIPDVASEILSTAIESVQLPMKDYEPDGGGYEGPSYWNYGSRYNVLFLDALDNSLGTDFGLSSMEGFRRSGDFQIHLSGTNLLCFNFSDSDLEAMSTAQHFWMGKKCDRPHYSGFRYMALQNGVEGNILDLLWFDDRFKDFDLNSMSLDKHFRVAEIITMRDSWDNGKGFVVAMKGGSSTRVHSHMDLGSFILEYDGVRWFTDFGKDNQTYQRHINKAGRWDFYRTRAEGHNTLVVNPEFRGSQKRTEDGIAEFIKFKSGKESAIAVLDVSKSYYNDVSFKRTFTLNRGVEFRIADEIKCKEPSELFLFYHTEAEIELTQNNRQAILKQDGKSIVVNLVKPLDAQFEVLSAEPLPTSPILPFQEKNEGTKKLSIHFVDAEDVDVEITIKEFKED